MLFRKKISKYKLSIYRRNPATRNGSSIYARHLQANAFSASRWRHQVVWNIEKSLKETTIAESSDINNIHKKL